MASRQLGEDIQMNKLEKLVAQKGLVFGDLTFGELCALAAETGHSAGELAIIARHATANGAC